MYYMAKCALFTKNLRAKTHNALISLFGLHFVKNNTFSKEMGKSLNNALEMRLSGDYDDGLLIKNAKKYDWNHNGYAHPHSIFHICVINRDII